MKNTVNHTYQKPIQPLLFYESYVEGRVPHRKYHYGFHDALESAMKYLKMGNISVSVWGYERLTDRTLYDFETGTTNRYRGIDYNSAVIDKIFFDFDVLDKKGNIQYDVLDSFRRYIAWVTDNDFRYEVAFTGGGYQTTFSAQMATEDYLPVVNWIIEKLDLKVDSVSTSDLRRVVGSFNFGKEGKSERNRWCISLYESELPLSFEEHRELARKRRLGINYYGSQTFIPPEIDKKKYVMATLEHDPNFSPDAGIDEILDHYGYSYDQICPWIRRIIEQPHVKHKHRLYIISYFKNIVGVTYSDMNILITKLLAGSHGDTNDGGHSIREGQVKNVYLRNLPFSVDIMHKEGLCPTDCEICGEFQRAIWRAAMK